MASHCAKLSGQRDFDQPMHDSGEQRGPQRKIPPTASVGTDLSLRDITE